MNEEFQQTFLPNRKEWCLRSFMARRTDGLLMYRSLLDGKIDSSYNLCVRARPGFGGGDGSDLTSSP